MAAMSPRPRFTVNADGAVYLDGHHLTEHARAWTIQAAQGHPTVLTLDLEVEADLDGVPVETVQVLSDEVAQMTAAEWDQVIASAGYSQSPGAAILKHLGGAG